MLWRRQRALIRARRRALFGAPRTGLTGERLNASRTLIEEERLYLESELRAEYNFEDIVGKSAALRKVLQQIEIVAPTDSTVLLLGETGTGKELIARALHSLSARKSRTFVRLNCAAIPAGLVESELFGHEKGAFTGALMQKKGRFEIADQGTLFLDEIGTLASSCSQSSCEPCRSTNLSDWAAPRRLRLMSD